MIKKYILSLLLVLSAVTPGFAQFNRDVDQRTVGTKVADIVMLLPAENTADFNRLMQELTSLGDVIPSLSESLTGPGIGDDVRIRYAIAGMTTYAAKEENSSVRKSVESGLIKSLASAKSDEIKDFLLIQLQYVSSEASVDAVSGYLLNSRLCDAAARVLVRVGSDTAQKALFDAMDKTSGRDRQSIIQSLGYLKYEPALAPLTELVSSQDINTSKTAMFALANIASPSSESLLRSKATAAGYIFDDGDALNAYILYLNNLLAKGENNKVVEEAAVNLMKTSGKIHAMNSGLYLYTCSVSEKKAISEIIKALDSDNKIYREAALLYSSRIGTPDMYKALMKKAQREKQPEIKAELVTAFGVRGDKEALPFILKSYQDKDKNVIISAFAASALLAGNELTAPIISRIANESDKEIISAGQSVLLGLSSPDLMNDIVAAFPQASSQAKVAMIEIIGKRGAIDKSAIIFAECNTPGEVGIAAVQALKSVVTLGDLSKVTALLDAAPANDAVKIANYQDALYASVSGIANKSEQVAAIRREMNTAANKYYFYNILAMAGGTDALQIVRDAYENGNTAAKQAAFESLVRWSDYSAAELLYQIAKNNPGSAEFGRALSGYISKVNTSGQSAEQRLLLLRRALSISQTRQQKESILRQLGRIGTFFSLVTAGEYLNDTELSQAAANAVIAIVQEHTEYYGEFVVDLINKAIQINKDPEAEYQKQALVEQIAAMPEDAGYVTLFNGKDLSGWKGSLGNPLERSKLTSAQLATEQAKADEVVLRDWKVENGILKYTGTGTDNISTDKIFEDFELMMDWRIGPGGDAGVYLRGTPEVEIWDNTLPGAQGGSGALFRNTAPIVKADNPVGEWNTLHITMTGNKVTVYLNGQLVTDKAEMQNYWDRSLPLFTEGSVELQAYKTPVEYRNLFIREIKRPKPYVVSEEEKAEGFVPIFNGENMSGWTGNLMAYYSENGEIVCDPKRGGSGDLFTEKEYSNFIMRFEFMMTPATNNGLGIRTPMTGDPAYVGMELQILDNDADVYKNLENYQYHGSVYGVITAERGYLKPIGEWNVQEVIADGNHIKVTLNGTVILDGDLARATNNFSTTLDKLDHPGIKNKSGHIGFLGHGSYVRFRNIRIKEL